MLKFKTHTDTNKQDCIFKQQHQCRIDVTDVAPNTQGTCIIIIIVIIILVVIIVIINIILLVIIILIVLVVIKIMFVFPLNADVC